MITPAYWKATSIDMHTNKVWILDGGDKDDYSHGESASTVEYSSWTSHCATLPQIRKNKRGGKVKLQSILIPQSDFDHAEKGDALHDIAEDMRAPSYNSSQNSA